MPVRRRVPAGAGAGGTRQGWGGAASVRRGARAVTAQLARERRRAARGAERVEALAQVFEQQQRSDI